MAFRKAVSHLVAPESPDRLFHDLPRRKHPSLFDHQGQTLRSYHGNALGEADVALQLPTGTGKTLVGLLIAEWRRRKYGEKVVYLCPTRQLVNQVSAEASVKYGLALETFTGKAKDYSPKAKAAYDGAYAIAVTTYNSLFNINPYFKNPDIIILDDAHAAESYIANQWSVRISRRLEHDQPLFASIAAVLKSVLTDENYSRLTGNWRTLDDATWVDKLPTSSLSRIADELRVAMAEHIHGGEQRYPWSMLSGNLRACQLYLSSDEILIRPLIPPTWLHEPFARAKQRIFMSATLGECGDLERLTGRTNILRLPIPKGWDRQGIGRRFFIFPSKSLDDDETLKLRHSLMASAGRSLVLTPSNDLADQISRTINTALSFPVFNGKDLETDKTKFTLERQAVAVLANRYDGIDLPDEDCRLLFMDELPRTVNLQERFIMTRMGAALLFNERVQTRVMQAVGRCTRGLNDYSAVVITGEDLPAYLTDRNRRQYLHPELQAELEFGINQSTDVDIQTLVDNFKIFIDHGKEWEEANDSILEARDNATQLTQPGMSDLSAAVVHEIAWQKAIWQGDYVVAYSEATAVLGKIIMSDLRGYRALWHYLAGSAAMLEADMGNSAFELHARTQFEHAKSAAYSIPWLVSLVRSHMIEVTNHENNQQTVMCQVEQLEQYLLKLGTLHDRKFSARENEIRDGLRGGANFEQAHVLLGRHLGYIAEKHETDGSPDPWWQISNIIFVFEDHANANAEGAVIDTRKARQASSHPDWIRDQVPGSNDATIYPILITPAKQAKKGAMPHLKRVMYWNLEEFREWAEQALVAIREIRRDFTEPGDLLWRERTTAKLTQVTADAPGLSALLSKRQAHKYLYEVP